jgi:8-oxo-dGTP diphosphatase
MKYTPIIGTLGYVLSEDKTKVLLIHRNAREGDDHLGKYNGLGGKMDSDEDVYTSMKRELFEEAQIIATQMSLRGTINWTGFGPKGENWLGFIFLIEKFEGEVAKKCAEGDLEWVPIKDLATLPMWEGDKYFLPLLFDDNPKIFHGFMPYENDKPLNWSYTRESK